MVLCIPVLLKKFLLRSEYFRFLVDRVFKYFLVEYLLS